MRVKRVQAWVFSREEWVAGEFDEWFGEWEEEWGYPPGTHVWGVEVWVPGTSGEETEHESALMVRWPDGAGSISIGWGSRPLSGYWEEYSDLGQVLRVDLENGIPCPVTYYLDDGSVVGQ